MLCEENIYFALHLNTEAFEQDERIDNIFWLETQNKKSLICYYEEFNAVMGQYSNSFQTPFCSNETIHET